MPAPRSSPTRSARQGIVGYGHIGSQLSVLAEAMGMHVTYYDVLERMSLGNAQPQPSLDALLGTADFVTLHVPERPDTRRMIRARELAKMRSGAYLINASRGSVVRDTQPLAPGTCGFIVGCVCV